MTSSGHLKVANMLVEQAKGELTALPLATLDNLHDMFGPVNELEHRMAQIWFALADARMELEIETGIRPRILVRSVALSPAASPRREATLDDLA